MCTVVVRRSPGRPVELLAVRDELTTREFDDPGRWWPEFPDVVGGRDRVAGGTWCATHLGTGGTALVLNRYHERPAAPGAPSRGVLPLLGAVHGSDWGSHVRLDGMAGFLLVLATPDQVTTWDFDGDRLTATDHKADRWLEAFDGTTFPAAWRGLVQAHPPADDPSALVVRHERDGRVFGTVFAELIDARPGRLRLEYSREPWLAGTWDEAAFEPA
jgi:hypothetical protein